MHLHFNDLQIEGAAWQWRTHYISSKYWQNVGKLQIIVCEPFKKKIPFTWNFANTTIVILIHRLNTESKLIIIYALLIVCGFNLLETNSNAREPLLTLARHLKSTSNVTDGWGEGLLGAIGLKKETTSNRYERNGGKFECFVLNWHLLFFSSHRRKIVAKCLACIIFALFLERWVVKLIFL